MVADPQHDEPDPFGTAPSEPAAASAEPGALAADAAADAALTPTVDEVEASEMAESSDPQPLDAEAEASAAELDAAQAELDAAAAREEQLTRLFTATIMGPGEERIGKVGQVYLDDQTQEPNWITAKTGLFGTKEFFIPLDEAQLDGKHILVPYTKADVTTAPVTEIDQNLSPDEEDALYNHYRVPGRMTIEIAELDEAPLDAAASSDDAIVPDADAAAVETSIESLIADAPSTETADDPSGVDDGEPVTVAPHAPLAEPHSPSAPTGFAPGEAPAPSPFAAPDSAPEAGAGPAQDPFAPIAAQAEPAQNPFRTEQEPAQDPFATVDADEQAEPEVNPFAALGLDDEPDETDEPEPVAPEASTSRPGSPWSQRADDAAQAPVTPDTSTSRPGSPWAQSAADAAQAPGETASSGPADSAAPDADIDSGSETGREPGDDADFSAFRRPES